MKNSILYRLSQSQHNFILAIRPLASKAGLNSTTTKFEDYEAVLPFKTLNALSKKAGYSIVPMWVMHIDRKIGRGLYMLPELFADDSSIDIVKSAIGRPSGKTTKIKPVRIPVNSESVAPQALPAMQSSGAVTSVSSTFQSESHGSTTNSEVLNFATQYTGGDSDSFVPAIDPNYINWGYHTEIKKIIKSSEFCPMFITGMSGNGKTTMIEQVCGQLNRECIRVNLTAQTDEDELIGGFRLQAGATVFCPGPALVAMQRGAVLLLDEVDLATHLIMCMQSILEGKGKFIPKIGKFVRPAKGFTIVATANTKGKGSEDGRFIGTNQMNEAFLERFRFCYEQDYASIATEKKIIAKYADSLGVDDDKFVDSLVNWADIIRKSFKQQIVNEIITTRRLRDIIFAFSIFGNKMTAIERCVSRFDADTKTAFMDFYTKCDAEALESNTFVNAGDTLEDYPPNKDATTSTIVV